MLYRRRQCLWLYRYLYSVSYPAYSDIWPACPGWWPWLPWLMGCLPWLMALAIYIYIYVYIYTLYLLTFDATPCRPIMIARLEWDCIHDIWMATRWFSQVTLDWYILADLGRLQSLENLAIKNIGRDAFSRRTTIFVVGRILVFPCHPVIAI